MRHEEPNHLWQSELYTICLHPRLHAPPPIASRHSQLLPKLTAAARRAMTGRDFSRAAVGRACTTVPSQLRRAWRGRCVNPHRKLRGNNVELFAAGLVDHMQCAAAAGALAVCDVGHHLVARQMRGQIANVALCRRRPALPLCRLWCNGILVDDAGFLCSPAPDLGVEVLDRSW